MNKKPFAELHCIELVTARNLAGSVTISSKDIRARILSYDNCFDIDPGAPIFLRTEENEIVSLYDSFTSIGLSTRAGPSNFTCHKCEIFADKAVVGHDRWTEKDRIRRVTFVVENVDRVLRNERKMKALTSSRYAGEDAFLLFKDEIDGKTISAHYEATYGMEFDSPKSVVTRFSIEFHHPIAFPDYMINVADFTRFFSFCLGSPLRPSEITIDRLSNEETKAAIEEGNYPGNHRVHYLWSEHDTSSDDLWHGASPVIAWEDHDLTNLRNCLIAWVDRSSIWREANSLMENCFIRNRELSVDRLIAACRWFEQIPIAASKQAISDEDINVISRAANESALARGLSTDMTRRIAGAIKQLKKETAEEKFIRLIELVKQKFGAQSFPETGITFLKKIPIFRGKGAHGHFSPSDENEMRAFSGAVHILEALCMLLTAHDLPINQNGVERLQYNPMVRDASQCQL